MNACSTAPEHPGELRIVTSIDVYADIARTVAGGHAEITSFIDDPAQDPHSYEATARNQLAAARADVIIENGGGYDDFMDRMRTASHSSATVINAVRLSARTRNDEAANEHVWYDFPTVARLATRLSAVLSAHDPVHRASFHSNAARFVADVRGLEQGEAAIRAGYARAGVAITEPVPVYLLDACGLVDKTPPAFSTAVEDGTDVSAGVLERTLGLFRSHAVAALVYNEQTSGAQTSQVLDAARAAHVPRVAVTETLPRDEHYVAWMRANIANLRAALSGVSP
ncbi:MAG TPA: zinc ABC transporter substrate-binding protein [Jatrophihabitantaceae bacterium]